MMNFTVKKTFINFSLKTGSELISIIGIITSCLFISFGILGPLIYGDYFFDEMKYTILLNTQDHYLYTIYICAIFLSLFYLIISIALYIGTVTKVLTLILPWFYSQLLYILAVFLIICVCLDRMFIAFTFGRLTNCLIITVYIFIKFYFFICVRSFVLELRLEECRKNLLANISPVAYAEYNNL